MARRDGAGVRLITRNCHDFTARFPIAAAAVAALPGRSFLLDGEAIVTDDSGLAAVFELIRRHRHGAKAVLCAFDLIEFDGQDLCRQPIEQRKAKLAKLVRGPHPGIVLNEHYDGDGEIVFKHACKLGCEGIVSKRLGRIIARAVRSAGSRSRARRASGDTRGRRGLEPTQSLETKSQDRASRFNALWLLIQSECRYEPKNIRGR